MKYSSLIAGLLLTTAIAIPAALSFAAATPSAPENNSATAAPQWLSIAQVYSQLEAAGYRNIEKIEREHGNYEVKATHRDGQRVKLHVHPQTGAVLDMRPRKNKDLQEGHGWGNPDKSGKPGVECNQRRCRDDLPATATGARP